MYSFNRQTKKAIQNGKLTIMELREVQRTIEEDHSVKRKGFKRASIIVMCVYILMAALSIPQMFQPESRGILFSLIVTGILFTVILGFFKWSIDSLPRQFSRAVRKGYKNKCIEPSAPKAASLFDPQRTKQFIELASVLSDNDNKLLEIINLYINNKTDEFIDKFQPIIDENDPDLLNLNEELDIEDIVKYGLICFGYVSYNDWKFPLEDLLFNSEKAFKHYGIDMSVYNDIPNQDELCAPEALDAMSRKLPDGFGLGMWDFGEDSIVLIVSRKSTLELSEKLGKELDLQIYAECSDYKW